MNIQTTFFYNNLNFKVNKRATIKKITQKQSEKILRNKDILNYAKQGISPFKIAELFNISYDTVHRIIKKYIKTDTVEIRHKNIFNLLMQGLSRKEIAELEGLISGTRSRKCVAIIPGF